MPSFPDNILPLTAGQSLGSSTLPWNVFASQINVTNPVGLTVTGLNNSGNETITGNLTVNGTTTLNSSVQYGINLVYPGFTNTPPNASTAIRQFDQYCAPDTDGLRG